MQGSGKGTQGKVLAEKYGLKVFEMGGQLRQMIESESALGQKVKEINDHVKIGGIIGVEISIDEVSDCLKCI